MLSKKLAVLVTAALMALMIIVVGVMPAFAQGRGPSACSEYQGFQGQFFSGRFDEAGEPAGGPPPGFSGTFNPGGITLGITPLVPTGGFFCNPNFTE